MHRIKDKVAVVTGGGRNIGRAISIILANEGAKVCVLDIDVLASNDVVDIICNDGKKAEFFKCNVTSVKEIESNFQNIWNKYGKIDILVNNVGESAGITLEDITEDIFNKNIDLNVKSSVFCTKAALPFMKKQRKGSVIFISSINANLGGFSEVMYAASKKSLEALAKVLAADYSKFGIRFNVVSPGSVPGDSMVWKERELEKPGTLGKLESIYPLKRVGKPEDVAYAVLFYASDESSWITGTVLPVDGGITATGRLPGGKWWEEL